MLPSVFRRTKTPGFGWFSGADGWVKAEALLVRKKLELPLVASLLAAGATTPIIENTLWDLGRVRLPNRRTRVAVWFGRRLDATWVDVDGRWNFIRLRG